MNGSSQHCTGGNDQNYTKEKKHNKAKWLSEEALQIAEKRREVERQRIKGKIHPTECRVPETSKERQEDPLR